MKVNDSQPDLTVDARPVVRVKLAPGAKPPIYAHDDDAGADLFALDAVTIRSSQRRVIATGVHVQPPASWCFSVRPKSGLSKRGLVVVPGLIDPGYRGEIGVMVENHSTETLTIKAGDKVAQLVLERATQARFELASDLDASARGAGGWGSTGDT